MEEGGGEEELRRGVEERKRTRVLSLFSLLVSLSHAFEYVPVAAVRKRGTMHQEVERE